MFGVLEWTHRGFVLSAQPPLYEENPTPEMILANQMTEYMKRVYDFGPISNGRDLNGDGVVNSQDLNDYNTAWGHYNGKRACNWGRGDIDQDNDVDAQDKLTYSARYFSNSAVPIHLGTAEPMDALTKP